MFDMAKPPVLPRRTPPSQENLRPAGPKLYWPVKELFTSMSSSSKVSCGVFSCSMLHQALPVLSGRRYVYLPFLYDETGAQVRRENSRFLDRKPDPADAEAGEEDEEPAAEPNRAAAPR